MRFALSLLLIALSFTAQAAKLSHVANFLNSTIYSCPERIWDGLNWNQKTIHLLSLKEKSVWHLHDKKIVKERIEKNPGFSGDFKIENQEVWVNIDQFENPKDAFALTVHEGFHAFGQTDLKYDTLGRNDSYPAKAEPRIQREEISRALIGYFRGEVGSLEKAKGWHNRHKISNEKLGSDVIEGSAEYVEKISTAIADLGCSAPEINIVNHAVDSLADDGVAFDKEYEHYRIGALAFLISRTKHEYTLKKLDGVKSLLDIVLEDVREETTLVTDTLLEHAVEMTVGMSNRQAEEAIAPVREGLESKKTFVFIPFKKLKGSFIHTGSYVSEGKTFYQNLEIKLEDNKIAGQGLETFACGEEKGFLVLDGSAKSTKSNSQFQGAPVICL